MAHITWESQLYTSFLPEDSRQAMERLERCIEDIRLWMNHHFLKLNDSKTEFMIFGTKQDITKVSELSVTVGGNKIMPSSTARNIGAYLDAAMNMGCHVNNTIRSCYYQLRAISQIRKYLFWCNCETLPCFHNFQIRQLKLSAS